MLTSCVLCGIHSQCLQDLVLKVVGSLVKMIQMELVPEEYLLK